jgi:transglutaminase-like putative cysteine protease
MDSPKGKAALGVAYQIPRNTLALLMIAQVVVIVPYLLHLSPWLIAVGLFSGYWRTRVYQGVWDYPGRLVKAVLVVASIAAVVLSGIEGFSLEAVSSLLIIAFALKLIEMKNRRDAYLVIFLSYFVIAIQFLFDQSILMALYELVAIVVVTAAMVGLNQLHTQVRPLVSLKLAGALVVQALPFTIVVFLLFPRIAPLWSVPLPNSSTTGISDELTPGDIASLTQSDEPAFRVIFDGERPPSSELYWRGLVYSEFDQGTWRVGPRLVPQAPRVSLEDGLRYAVLLEPTFRNWLFALDLAEPGTNSVRPTRDFRLEASEPVLSVFRYEVRSDPRGLLDPGVLPEFIRIRETAIDPTSNPRLTEFARSLWQQTGSAVAFTEAVLRSIRQEEYFYTLQPPTYTGAGTIDQFWFDGRAGFCTHYAGALVYMLRVAGIPARMVGGYQGGELNPITGHLIIRQYDAHAWAEVWQPETGWQRVDPTAAVAPARIEQGLSAALSAADRSSLSIFSNARIGDWAIAGSLLELIDSVELRWNLWVVGFDGNVQSGLLKSLLGELTPARVGMAMLGGGGLSLIVVLIVLFWRRRTLPRHPVELAFSRFAARLAAQGYPRRPEESPSGFVTRIASQVGLSDAQVGGVIAELDTLLYNPSVAWGNAELKQLKRQLRRLQFRLAFGATR